MDGLMYWVFVVTFSRQASVQIENLQEQLQALAAQRDRAVMDLASSQEAAHQYQSSVNNLQLVLEQFQRGTRLQCWRECFAQSVWTTRLWLEKSASPNNYF